MRIALCSSFVPHILGGARNIVEWLQTKLVQAGHQVELIYLPEIDTPRLLYQQMAAYRWIDLSAADRIICFKPLSHLIPHPHKILWFTHYIHTFYDLWDTPYRHVEDNLFNRTIRDNLYQIDTRALHEAKKIFTQSQAISQHLKNYNQVDCEVLYPPIIDPERFTCDMYNDEIICIDRLEHYKRQHLLIEALQYTKTPVRLRICGSSHNELYANELQTLIQHLGEKAKHIVFENRRISEAEKISLLANCLAFAYIPLKESACGYPSIEASLAHKAILTTTDAGGIIELVQDGINGYVAEPSAHAIAEALDKLYLERKKTQIMGNNAYKRLTELNISWEHALSRLLA